MPLGKRAPGSRGRGKPMGGCAQPAKLSGFIHRCCVAFAAASMMSLALAATDAQAAPAAKRAEPAGTSRTAAPKASAPAPTQTQAAQPRKIIKVARHTKHEHTSDREHT